MAMIITMFKPMRRTRRRFTLRHGLVSSLALHGAVFLPLIVDLWPEEPDSVIPLAFDLDGALSDSESDEKIAQDSRGTDRPEQPKQVSDPEKSTADVEEDPGAAAAENVREATSKPPRQTMTTSGARNTTGDEEERKAQTSTKHPKEENDLVNAYAKQLSKRIRRLAYPAKARASGLHGSATVSFTIGPRGEIVANTLRVVSTSGLPLLDADALRTVRAASPFPSPPREMTVAIEVFASRR